MTSIPASRSARAMTLAPRSWPSSPGFAMMTRSFRFAIPLERVRSIPISAGGPPFAMPICTFICKLQLDHRHFLVLAPHVPQRIAQLAERRVGADRIEDGRHQVIGGRRRGPHAVERATDQIGVAGRPQPLEP